MEKIKFALLIFFGFFIFIILGTQKVQAADISSQEVIINEVMWMGSTKSTADEWIELYNMTDQDIPLAGWRITCLDGNGSETLMLTIPADKIIQKNDYFLISNYDKGHNNTILDIKPDFIDTAVLLSNSKLQIKLYNQSGKLVDIADDGIGVPLAGSKVVPMASMERNDIPGDGTLAENWHTAVESINFIKGVLEKGTPQRSRNREPSVPLIQSPLNGQEIIKGENIQFSWFAAIDPDGDEISYEFYLGCDQNLEETDLVDAGFTETNYTVEELEGCLKYYWQIVASDGSLTTPSAIFSFTLIEPVYSDAIIINELYPDPSSGEEWIELFNNSAEAVNLKDWILEDLKGSIHQYKINEDLIIPGFGYLAILKSQSGITLNNDQDGGRLTRPDGKILYETPIYAGGEKGWSYARTSTGDWVWTTQITPGLENIIVAPIIITDDEEKEEDVPKNSTPIEIKTGEYQNFADYLVKVQGTVIETSGNTFYLDDSSGKAKIYIQEKTRINKPKMYKGDIYNVIGIVNLFRNVWRILPRMQGDIKLIQAIKKEEEAPEVKKVAVAKSSTKSSTAASKQSSSTTSKARSPTKKIASATSLSPPENQNIRIAGAKSPFWLQTVKTLTGLMVIFLILLFIKIFQFKKERPWTGKFGDDFT